MEEIYFDKIYYRSFQPSKSTGNITFIHGISCSSNMWRPLLEEFVAKGTTFRLVAPDMPGYGQSPYNGEGVLDIIGLATWLHQFLKKIGIMSSHIVGNRYVHISSFLMNLHLIRFSIVWAVRLLWRLQLYIPSILRVCLWSDQHPAEIL